MANLMTGAEIVFKVLEDQGVKHIFGYPGAVLPIYDELKNHKNIKHILVRRECSWIVLRLVCFGFNQDLANI
jgi:acetolactate synthase-1/2/3 large subunit|tara:strand:+ start:156 stop:371 length:216 start_codon:yes stop_codon:yes gene_type:complete